jgi:hypothetical protein
MTKLANNISRIIILGLAFIFLNFVSGCSLLDMKWGTPPHIDRLSDLTPGVSKSADVLLALGEPRGHGKSRWALPSKTYPNVSSAFDIWEYEYTAMEVTDVDLTILILFFKGDVYEGHLWFSSNLEIKKE